MKYHTIRLKRPLSGKNTHTHKLFIMMYCNKEKRKIIYWTNYDRIFFSLTSAKTYWLILTKCRQSKREYVLRKRWKIFHIFQFQINDNKKSFIHNTVEFRAKNLTYYLNSINKMHKQEITNALTLNDTGEEWEWGQ